MKLEGRLAGESVQEFVRNAEKNDRLDLSDLDFVDHEGVRALRKALDSGASILRISPFVKIQLGISVDV
jgi:hypothetical protein